MTGARLPLDGNGPDAEFPAEQVPPPLLGQANSLMEKLGYRPMGPGTALAGRRPQFGPGRKTTIRSG